MKVLSVEAGITAPGKLHDFLQGANLFALPIASDKSTYAFHSKYNSRVLACCAKTGRHVTHHTDMLAAN